MLCNIRIAGHCTDAHAFIREFLDLREWQPIDINQPIRRFHAHFHQVDQIRSATKEFALGFSGDSCDSLIRILCAHISKRIHARPLVFASLIAARIFG